MKTGKKLGLIFSSFLLLTSFSFASSDVSSSFEQQRSSVISLYQDSYQRAYSGFIQALSPWKYGYTYKALQCLGAVSESQFLALMQAEIKQTTVNFLNGYTALYADILSSSLLGQGNNGISSGQQLQLASFVAQQTGIMAQFESQYATKTKTFVADVQSYITNNSLVLSGLVNKMQSLDVVSQRYQKVLTNIVSLQSRIAGSNAVFFDRLPMVKSGFLDVMDANLSTTISRQVKQYPILKTLSGALAQQKIYAKSLFALQFDEDVAVLFSGWYDSKTLLLVKKDMEKMQKYYQSNGEFSCSPLSLSTGFSQEIASLMDRISLVEKSLVSSTGTSLFGGRSFTGYVTQWSTLVEQDRRKHEQLFSTAMNDITKRLLNEYKQQQVSISTGIIQQQPSSSLVSSYTFVRAFSLNQKHGDILVLQQLLTRLGYYTGTLNSIYTKDTKQAVYQFQLAKGLLKGYEKKPQTWGWMGPATRKALTVETAR